MAKYTYGVTFTILATVESDVPLTPDEIISQAECETGVDRCNCNDVDATGLYNTPDPYTNSPEDLLAKEEEEG